MNTLRKLLSVACIGLLLVGFVSNAQAHDARVAKITGTAEVQLPGETAFKSLAADMAVPQGATIRTAAGAQVFLEVFPGGIATIDSDSTVLVEKLALEK